MDAVYPEPLFRQHRRAVRKKMHRGPGSRYRTQPVTFAEIQEVDEENAEDQSTKEQRDAAKSERDLHARFHEFWRRNKQEDLPSSSPRQHHPPASASVLSTLPDASPSPSPSPSPGASPTIVSDSQPPLPPLSGPRRGRITQPTESSSASTSKSLLSSQSQQSNLSPPIHKLSDRKSPSRTSI